MVAAEVQSEEEGARARAVVRQVDEQLEGRAVRPPVQQDADLLPRGRSLKRMRVDLEYGINHVGMNEVLKMGLAA